jgi:hypothetical protein
MGVFRDKRLFCLIITAAILFSLEEGVCLCAVTQNYQSNTQSSFFSNILLLPINSTNRSTDDSIQRFFCPNSDSIIGKVETVKQYFRENMYAKIPATIINTWADFAGLSLQTVKHYYIPIASNDISLNLRI